MDLNFQILKLFLIAALFIITPLLSSSLRPTYLYFVFNLLIIALGAEAGLLKFFSNPSTDHDKKQPPLISPEASPPKSPSSNTTNNDAMTPQLIPKKPKVAEKSLSEKIVGSARMRVVKKCPSTPSLFFIGGGEAEAEEVMEDFDEEDNIEEAEDMSGQELYTKAEMFICNFYKQLKMQREDSWKRIHGLYHKAF